MPAIIPKQQMKPKDKIVQIAKQSNARRKLKSFAKKNPIDFYKGIADIFL